MIEIKFRGISTDTNEWVYGCYIFLIGIGSDGIEESFNTPPTMSDPCGSSDYVRHEIKTGTIGQFVGLQDKNKKDIYEGDKIQFYTREMIQRSGIVKFKSCSFYIDDEDGTSYFAWDDYSMIEIIN